MQAGSTVNINWVDSELLNSENVSEILKDADGILSYPEASATGESKENTGHPLRAGAPGAFSGLPASACSFLSWSMRNAAGCTDAHSIELDPATAHPVIALMPDQNGVEDIGGTLRLGAYPCILDKTSRAYRLYGQGDDL